MPPDSTEQNGNECWVGYSIDDLLAGAAADKFASEESSEAVKYFAQRVRNNKGIYPAEKQAASRKILKPFQSGDVLYFPGCVTKAHFPATVAGMVTIAEKAGARLMTDSDQQVCCGAPSVFAGDLDTARELVQRNYEYIQNSGAEIVVCDCPECTRVLRQAYPRLDFALSQPVLHASEWIWSLLESGAISFASPPLDQEDTPSVA
ncbi:MAG TPA: (Fe-S)-binding protein, partial [Candidatus Lokiarchaeia archaeon]|nr:(Fe-S)-binding protein [Candidatus Lokiarchaeia archaeon]